MMCLGCLSFSKTVSKLAVLDKNCVVSIQVEIWIPFSTELGMTWSWTIPASEALCERMSTENHVNEMSTAHHVNEMSTEHHVNEMSTDHHVNEMSTENHMNEM